MPSPILALALIAVFTAGASAATAKAELESLHESLSASGSTERSQASLGRWADGSQPVPSAAQTQPLNEAKAAKAGLGRSGADFIRGTKARVKQPVEVTEFGFEFGWNKLQTPSRYLRKNAFTAIPGALLWLLLAPAALVVGIVMEISHKIGTNRHWR